VRVLSRYYKYLAERYPEEYFNAHKELLLPCGCQNGTRSHHEVAMHLKKMKAIRGLESLKGVYRDAETYVRETTGILR